MQITMLWRPRLITPPYPAFPETPRPSVLNINTNHHHVSSWIHATASIATTHQPAGYYHFPIEEFPGCMRL